MYQHATDCSWPVGFLTGIDLFPFCQENPDMPSKNKTKKSEIYWAIPYNMRPSPKEKKTRGWGGVTLWAKCKGGGYTGKDSKTKNQGGGGGIMRQK